MLQFKLQFKLQRAQRQGDLESSILTMMMQKSVKAGQRHTKTMRKHQNIQKCTDKRLPASNSSGLLAHRTNKPTNKQKPSDAEVQRAERMWNTDCAHTLVKARPSTRSMWNRWQIGNESNSHGPSCKTNYKPHDQGTKMSFDLTQHWGGWISPPATVAVMGKATEAQPPFPQNSFRQQKGATETVSVWDNHAWARRNSRITTHCCRSVKWNWPE